MIRNILAAAAGVIASLAAVLGFAAAPAMASVPAAAPAITSTHVMFAVVDNGGVLVTRQPLAAHQVVYSGGVAHTVSAVHGDIITLTPGLPWSDIGKTVVFST